MILKTKLIGGSSVVAATTVAVGIVGIVAISMLKKDVNTITSVNIPTLEALADMNAGMDKAVIAQRGLTIQNIFADKALRETQFNQMNDALKRIDEAWKVYEPLPQSPEEAAAWKVFTPKFEAWKKTMDAFVELCRKEESALGATESAAMAIDATGKRRYEAMLESRTARIEADQALNNVEQIVKAYVTADSQSAQALAARMMVAMVSGNVVGVVVALLLGILLGTSISNTLKKIIDGLGTGAEQVTSASGQVSGASQSLAQGAGEQASSLEETSSALEEMASMTRQNADNASQANGTAKEAAGLAATGVESMAKMQDAIARIKDSAEATAKIIKTIDEIAFQTNLLALNAAVEAARAGEAGKGFAVVAEEVRNLARRSAEAAKNTADLIEGAQKHAEAGVAVTAEVANNLGGIKESVGKVAALIAEIAAASKEQSQGIDQVNTAVSEMDTVVQQNAANAEESASASEELSGQAQELNAMVGELTAIVTGSSTVAVSHASGAGARRSTGPLAPSHGAAAASHPKAVAVARAVLPSQAKGRDPSRPMAKAVKPQDVIALDDKDLREF